jgi:hypothetical protein
MRNSVCAPPGLTARRSKRAHCSICVGPDARREHGRDLPLAPLAADVVEHLIPLLALPAPRVVLVPATAREGAVERERGGALGVGRGEQHPERPALGDAEQRRALRAGGVHHRADVVHALLERRHRRDAIGHSGPATIEQHHARERRQTAQERGERRHLPRLLDVRHPAGDHDHVGTLAEHLVGDVHVAAARVARRGRRERAARRARLRHRGLLAAFARRRCAVLEPRRDRAQHALVQGACALALGGAPGVEVETIGEVEPCEQLAAERVRELAQRGRRQSVEAVLGGRARAQDVDPRALGHERHRLAVGAQPLAARRVDQRAQLGQRPAQLRGRVVGAVPEQLAQMLAAVRTARQDQVGEQRARRARRRQRRGVTVAQHGDLAEEAQLERRLCVRFGHDELPLLARRARDRPALNRGRR